MNRTTVLLSKPCNKTQMRLHSPNEDATTHASHFTHTHKHANIKPNQHEHNSTTIQQPLTACTALTMNSTTDYGMTESVTTLRPITEETFSGTISVTPGRSHTRGS